MIQRLSWKGRRIALRGIVQAAAIAHERAARRGGDQLAERRDAVLERHALSAVASR
jgi:hypothetical protein